MRLHRRRQAATRNDESMRLAIYGAGSLGTVLGAYITKSGTEIDLVNRNVAHVEALRARGATIQGAVDFMTPVKALFPTEMTGTYDIIFLLTKQQSNAEVIQFLLPFLAPDGVVCTLQNGVPEPALAAAAGPARILGGTVEWGAEMTSPGICLLTSPPGSCSFQLGGLPGLNESRLRQAKEILELMCPTIIDQNFLGVRWAKLLINASFSGMSVVLGCTFGQVTDDRRAREVLQMVMKECIDTAAAAGVAIAPVQGTNIAVLFGFSGPIKKWIAFQLIPFAIRKHRDVTASMLQDIQKGKKTEVDAINGVVCEWAQRVNVPTPYNQMVVRIVHEFEEGNGRPGFENLARFDEINRQ